MLRRRRADVLAELPECRRVRMSVDGAVKINDELRAICRRAIREAGGDVEHALAAVRFELGDGSKSMLTAYRDLGESKVETAIEWLTDNATRENPVVVFAHHMAVIQTIGEAMNAQGLGAAAIIGSVSAAERHEIVIAFQAGKIEVLICGITAASTGITLTRAAQMLAVELPWSPKTAEQMEARLVRIGQTRGVIARYMVAENTLDEHIWQMLEEKSDNANLAIDGTAEGGFVEHASEGVGRWAVLRNLIRAEARAA